MADDSAPQEGFDVFLDPPGGHAWGFPKKFDQSFGNDVNGWLLANGYPESEIAQWPDRRVPCWAKKVIKHESGREVICAAPVKPSEPRSA
ncbi:hypothetical protein [Sphingobium sp. SA916]|uniref:hypothetical protein n=1 Tax=Sphingobium sp. SA916 TaxID=1851207 RepID=UPI0011AF88BE|nr:hypothetical protein [Sphingobium sp. SA916]